MSMAARVSAALYPVLEPRGFADVQGGGDEGQFIFCASLDRIYEVDPQLCDSHDLSDLGRGGCFDVVVEIASGRIANVSIEGPDLEDRLREYHKHREADAIEAAYQQPATVALPTVAAGLSALFAAATDRVR